MMTVEEYISSLPLNTQIVARPVAPGSKLIDRIEVQRNRSATFNMKVVVGTYTAATGGVVNRNAPAVLGTAVDLVKRGYHAAPNRPALARWFAWAEYVAGGALVEVECTVNV